MKNLLIKGQDMRIVYNILQLKTATICAWAVKGHLRQKFSALQILDEFILNFSVMIFVQLKIS